MPAKKVADTKTDKTECTDAYCVRCKTKKQWSVAKTHKLKMDAGCAKVHAKHAAEK